MPKGDQTARINPKTGRRFGWVDPKAKPIETVEQIVAAPLAGVDPETLDRRLRLLKRQKAAIEAQGNLLKFIRFTMPDLDDPSDVEKSGYKDAKHHRATAAVLDEVVAERVQYLIFCMPPRHGKTEQVSRRLPAYYLGKYPRRSVAVGTYNDNFAGDLGKDVREIMRSTTYRQVFPGVQLIKGGQNQDHLITNQGGHAFFVGRGTAFTGRGCHLGIIDDPFKDDVEASSETMRDQAWKWFTKVFMTRRMGPKLVIITLTRWHVDDIVGRLTDPDNVHYNEKIAKHFKIINLPAIAEENDPLGRKPGEALWPDGPDKFDLEFLEFQRALDSLAFEALYQQRPSMLDGDLYKREDIRRWKTLPDDLRWYGASDHAVGVKQRNENR